MLSNEKITKILSEYDIGFETGDERRLTADLVELFNQEITSAVNRAVGEIRKEVEVLIPEIPINNLKDIAYAMRKYENLSEREKEHVRNRDNGFYIKMVEYSVGFEKIKQILSLPSLQLEEDKK